MTTNLASPLTLLTLFLASAHAQIADPTSHTIQFVSVEVTVKLEVLDWGGSGSPLIFLAGLGDTAHVFDKFAPKLTGAFHVYGITRRGFGSSTAPVPVSAATYSADRLGDDVLAVLAILKLAKPVLVGHSIAGEELSSIGSRYPERIAGLVYLDAGYAYAFYDQARGDFYLDLFDLKRKLETLEPGKAPNDTRPLIRELLQNAMPRFEMDLKGEQAFLDVLPPRMLAGSSASMLPASQAVIAGEQKYGKVNAPILAIFAVPHDMGFAKDEAGRETFDAQDESSTGAQVAAFQRAMPLARVVRLPHASHYVFRSHEADVLREIQAFAAGVR